MAAQCKCSLDLCMLATCKQWVFDHTVMKQCVRQATCLEFFFLLLRPPYRIGQAIIFLPCGFFYLSIFFFLAYWPMLTTLPCWHLRLALRSDCYGFVMKMARNSLLCLMQQNLHGFLYAKVNSHSSVCHSFTLVISV